MFDKLTKQLEKYSDKKYQLFVGWDDPELSKIAAIQEYGAVIPVTDRMRGFLSAAYGIHLKKSTTQIVIPPRAHKKQTIQKNAQKWQKELTKILQQVNFDIPKALEILGLKIMHDYKKVLTSGNFQELSSATMHIRSKTDIAGNVPLMATGELQRRMISEVTHV